MSGLFASLSVGRAWEKLTSFMRAFSVQSAPSSSASSGNQEDLVELMTMERTVRQIRAVLYDAEEHWNMEEPSKLKLQEPSKLKLQELKEVAYDMEDVVDDYEYEVNRCKVEALERDASANNNYNKRKREEQNEAYAEDMSVVAVPNELFLRVRRITSRFNEIFDFSDRFTLSKNDGERRFTHDISDLRQTSSFVFEKSILGREEDRDIIVGKLLSDEGKNVGSPASAMAIVGMGGLGKTTLANVVYEKLKGQFDCSAFVSVSQTPDFKKLFKGMLRQLDKEKYGSIYLEILDERQLINELRELLRGKRYLIVIDDICDISYWEVIKCALPDNNVGCKIITTTRILNIAQQADFVYKMEPLSPQNSRELLYRRIFSNENKDNNVEPERCPDEELSEVSERILTKCGGVPLAIIMIGSLLASKGRNETEWYEVYNSIGTGMEHSLNAENMRKILLYSYYDLPPHLKICLLYLSIFPEGYEIEKDRLIWLWIAEGFIQCNEKGKSLFELGESYFNELINRSLIQPVDSYTGMIYHCRVHDMVLDLIRSLSSEENLVTILRDLDHKSTSTTVRRLSLHNGNVYHAASTQATKSMSKVRSVVVFPSAVENLVTILRDLDHKFTSTTLSLHNGNVYHAASTQATTSMSKIPALPSFKILRVLDLQHCNLSQGYSLEYLGSLFLLRYLSLRSTRIDQLPKEVGNLQYLQTLDIWGNNISCLPSTIAQLKHLLCLYVDSDTKVPNGIGSIRSLEDLSRLRIDDESTGTIEELGLLTELRVLQIVLFTDKWKDKLVESLRKLPKIQTLSCIKESSCGGRRNMGGLDAWVAPGHLRTLNTRELYWFSTLPAWMNNSSHLPDLSVLEIAVRELQQEELETLGRLPSLRYLDLKVDHEDLGTIERFIVSAGSFPVLVRCKLWGFVGPVVFQQGAMPRLQCIEFDFYVWAVRELAGSDDDGFDFGLGNLPSLQEVKVVFRSRGASKEEVDEAKAVMRKAAEIHPNQPTLHVATDGKIDSVVDKAVPRTVYMKQTKLVGIDEAIDDLDKILLEGNEVSKQQGKIVSIVGLAGLGKTSLANALYGKLRAQFDCGAFVSVARNLDIKKLFKCMLYQLGKKHSASVHEEIWDERLLMYELIELLQKKRYLIIIDGIWNISVWQSIRDALPDNRCGYRIITTTREINIAEQIGGAYKLKPLGLQNSKVLLYRRMFGSEDKCSPDEQLAEVSDKILMICAGIPLAIIVIAGLLASKGRNKMEWFNVYNSIMEWLNVYNASVTGLENNTDVNNTELILSLSYTDLPSHLKNCLSYLSVFPEDYDIEKVRLIRLWIAEGFIQCKKQESLFELGDSYFYELIKRSMIQPVYKRWYYDITEYCRVPDTVLDLCYLSSKAKYVTILNYKHLTLPLGEVRWLSFQNSMVSHATHRATVSMQQVTSIVVFPSAINLMPSLLSFRVLRVLDLQSCHLSQGCSLQYLGNLFDLRYLGLRDTGITQLTEEIGNLQSLQTLDVTSNEISSLPPTVVQLRHLMCLSIDSWTRVPNGIGSLTSLEELSTLCIDDSTDIIEELGQLTELRVMGIDCHTMWNVDSLEKSLVECLHRLQKVQTLSLSVFGEYKLEAWVPPQHIRRLELKGCLSSPLRTWINPPLLLDLSFLSVEMRKLRQEDLEILGGLPALIYLDLEVDHQSIGTVQRLVVGDCSFPCLVQCMLRGYIAPVVFQQGAMPRLARLHLTFPVREMRETADVNGCFDWGLANLPSLQDVTFLVRRGGAIKADVEEAEAALRHAIEIHPNHPVLEIYADDADC